MSGFCVCVCVLYCYMCHRRLSVSTTAGWWWVTYTFHRSWSSNSWTLNKTLVTWCTCVYAKYTMKRCVCVCVMVNHTFPPLFYGCDCHCLQTVCLYYSITRVFEWFYIICGVCTNTTHVCRLWRGLPLPRHKHSALIWWRSWWVTHR